MLFKAIEYIPMHIMDKTHNYVFKMSKIPFSFLFIATNKNN